MSVDTYSYFLIVLSGFFTVWGYRKASQWTLVSNKKPSDFEYLAYSAFWGTMLLALYEEIERHHPDQISKLLTNPYAAGALLSVLGMVVGICTFFTLVMLKTFFNNFRGSYF
jgi:hypothetical protein